MWPQQRGSPSSGQDCHRKIPHAPPDFSYLSRFQAEDVKATIIIMFVTQLALKEETQRSGFGCSTETRLAYTQYSS